MSGWVLLLIGGFVLWLLGCAWCGFMRRMGWFLGVMVLGMVANAVWMILGLKAHPLESHFLFALGRASVSAGCGAVIGWSAGRLYRRWQDPAIKAGGV